MPTQHRQAARTLVDTQIWATFRTMNIPSALPPSLFSAVLGSPYTDVKSKLSVPASVSSAAVVVVVVDALCEGEIMEREAGSGEAEADTEGV